MSELQYGFVNENGILINTAVFDSDNLDIIETIKEHYQAPFYYLIDNPTSFPFIIGTTYWNGTRFLNPAPYPSWIWNEEIDSWEWFDKMLFKLYAKSGDSIRDIAERTHISTTSIFHTLKYCKERIKNNVSEDYEDYKNNDFELI